jgi:GGDEF domain-containing protein
MWAWRCQREDCCPVRHMNEVFRQTRLTLGLVTLLTAAIATAQASTPHWALYGLGSLYLVPVILSAMGSGLYAAVAVGTVATAVSSILVMGDASLDSRAVLVGIIFRGVGYIGVGALVALYARSLHRLAYQDIVTGLPNRRAFFEHVSRWPADRPNIAVVACDVDDLKTINDYEGHAAGDAAICAVARSLVSALGPSAFVARVGGDEFLAVISAEPRADLAIPGASVGTAASVTGPSDLDHLIARADAELCRAKQGRHRTGVVEGTRAA